MKLRPAAVLTVLFVILPACSSGKKGPSPMKDETIFSASKMTLAIFNRGSRIDRTALESCEDQYPNLQVVDETAIHRVARDSGVSLEHVVGYGDDFAKYSAFKSFDLLLIAFSSGGKDYLRTVNFLGKYASTVLLDIPRPTCEQIFAAQRIVLLDSVPPYADLSVDGRPVGEAPRWVWLKDGTYELGCKLPEQKFKPVRFVMPKEVRTTCQRENVTADSRAQQDEPMTGEEKAGSALVYIVGGLVTVAAIILPILLLF